MIKNYAGITLTAKDDEPAEEASEKWWNFQASEHGEWETKLFGLSSIKALPIVKDGVPLVPELFEKFKMALESLGGNVGRVEEAFVVVNPSSVNVFNGHRSNMSTQHALTPSLFKKNDWQYYDSQEPVDRDRVRKQQARAETLEILETHHSRFSWNSTEDPLLAKVCLMAQGTAIDTAWKIAQGGFGVAASLDAGWFGQGQHSPLFLSFSSFFSGSFFS